MKKEKEVHQVVSVALAYIRCSCGWENKLHNLLNALRKPKTDEDLALETGLAFVEHQRKMEKR